MGTQGTIRGPAQRAGLGRARIADAAGARLARELVARIRCLTVERAQVTKELTAVVSAMAPTLLAVPAAGS
jgi:hypothetical protein